VNSSAADPRNAAIRLHDASVRSIVATVLSSPDIHAHNTFDQPNAVTKSNQTISGSGASVAFTFPAASVSKLEIELT
jgi:alpha-N-arabinofuranosidase